MLGVDEQERDRPVMWVCPVCSGSGERMEPRMYLPRGSQVGRTVWAVTRCSTCKGRPRRRAT